MYTLKANRQNRAAIATAVMAAHMLLAWLWMLMARAPLRPPDADAKPLPIFTRIIEQPRPQPLGTPAPVKITLIPVTRPKLPTPVVQLVEIETLDSPAPGPDPAASSAQLVTRPGPANSGGLGDPMSGGTRGVRLIRKVPAVYPSSSMQRGEAGVVQINARIDERGRVAEIKLLRSSGHELLDSAAIRAVGKWKFEPALENDRPVSVWHPINLVMSVYNKKYCRIRDEPVDAMVGDEVVEGATVFLPLGGDAALRKIIDDLDSSRSGAAAQIRALIDDWGPVLSIRPVVDAGIQGWVKREILPGSPQGNTGGVVQVRSDTYLVQHEKIVARWRVDTDPSGEVWCIHVGPAPRGN